MLAALQRYPRRLRSEIAREWGRRSQAVQASARMSREPDWDEMRMLSLQDRRGKVIREGITYRASGETTWQVRHAIGGRTNQVEIVVSGRVWRRCSRRSADQIITR